MTDLIPSEELHGLVESYQSRLQRARKWLLAAAVMAALCLCGMVYLTTTLLDAQAVAAGRGKRIEAIAKDVRTQLKILQHATGPEGIKAAQNQADAVVYRIDCNNRLALQDLVDTLVRRGVLAPGDRNIVVRCEDQPITTTTLPPTTTTTRP